MKTIIGAAIGVFAIGLILIGAGLRGTASTPANALAPSYAASPAGAPLPVADAGTIGTASGPVMINCAAGERALVRQVTLNGQPVSQVACVADAAAFATGAVAGGAPLAQPIAYRASTGNTLARRRVVYQEAAPARTVSAKRSWTKPLLVIGGSTAAGAGIGGLVGGKKGALIGAALGGGASTIYEATKR
jgi:hypothetical protein